MLVRAQARPSRGTVRIANAIYDTKYEAWKMWNRSHNLLHEAGRVVIDWFGFHDATDQFAPLTVQVCVGTTRFGCQTQLRNVNAG